MRGSLCVPPAPGMMPSVTSGRPTTVVFGDRDWILPTPNQRRELAPDHCRWLVIPRCGHAPMWDAPEQTLQLVAETVREAEGNDV